MKTGFLIIVFGFSVALCYRKAQKESKADRDFGPNSFEAIVRTKTKQFRNRGRVQHTAKFDHRSLAKLSPRFRRQHNRKPFATRLAAQIQRILLSINCRRAKRYLTSAQRCSAIQSTPFKQMKFYLATPKSNTLYSVLLPDGKLKDSSNHHGVAVVDPFPNVGFGHLVLVFYVDEISKRACDKKRGLSVDSKLCLSLARRIKCKNRFKTLLGSVDIAKKCEVNFIPIVYDKLRNVRIQELHCYSRVAGFGKCKKNTSSDLSKSCELVKNSQHCHSDRRLPKQKGQALCQTFSTCDRGILISGKWNNLTSNTERWRNIWSMSKMLARNGFEKQKIQLFYGGNYTTNTRFQNGFNAPKKVALRRHISHLCKADLCVDALVIYMNGPTLADGSFVLQDFNQNGVADQAELYSVQEFFDDIRDCAANHIVIFADQSYSGMLKLKLRQLIRESNSEFWNRVILITSGDEFDYSWYRGATEHWTNLTPKHPVSWAFENLGHLNSDPSLTSRRHAEDHTIYGAPLLRHLNDEWKEIMNQYMGCQDLSLT